MNSEVIIPSPLQEVLPNIFIKREDLIHPFLSGNKYRKLKYNILHALSSGYQKIVSFGGAYSNHIHALAFTCKEYQIPLQLYIRGEEVENPTLNYVKSTGADLIFIDRATYRTIREKDDYHFLTSHHPAAFIIPEGGTNEFALMGIKEMMDEIYYELSAKKIQFFVGYGSGGTSMGMLNAKRKEDQLSIVPVLKFPDFRAEWKQKSEILDIQNDQFHYFEEYHFGGYAKFTSDLIHFINSFKEKHQVPLDPIYTGKVFYAVFDQLKKGILDTANPIVIIHTGGLQGIKGFNERFGDLII